ISNHTGKVEGAITSDLVLAAADHAEDPEFAVTSELHAAIAEPFRPVKPVVKELEHVDVIGARPSGPGGGDNGLLRSCMNGNGSQPECETKTSGEIIRRFDTHRVIRLSGTVTAR